MAVVYKNLYPVFNLCIISVLWTTVSCELLGILDKDTCPNNRLLIKADTVSLDLFVFGDLDREFPENVQDAMKNCYIYYSAIGDPQLPNLVTGLYLYNIPDWQLVNSFVKNMSQSRTCELLKKAIASNEFIPAIAMINDNVQPLSINRQNFINVLVEASSSQTDMSASKFGCLVHKWVDEIISYVDEFKIMKDIAENSIFKVYTDIGDSLNADLECEWSDVPEAPTDKCFKSINVLFLNAIVNLIRLT